MGSTKTIFILILLLVISGVGIILLVDNKSVRPIRNLGTDLKNNKSSIIYAVGSLDDQDSTDGTKNYLMYKIDPRTGEVLKKSFKLPFFNDISYILSIKKYPDILFISADDVKNTNHWSLYAYDFLGSKLKELRSFQASSPSLKQLEGQDDIIEIHDTLTVDRQFKLIFESWDKLLTEKEYEKDYGEQPNMRTLRLLPEQVEEIDGDNFVPVAKDSYPFQRKISETISRDFEGGFRLGPVYITNNTKSRSVVDYIKSVDSNRFIATIDHTQDKVIAQKPISTGNSLKLLGFQPSGNIFYTIEYKEKDRSIPPSLNTYNVDTLERLHSHELSSITFLFNVSNIFSLDAKYLILNITKARKTRKERVNTPESYLFIYDIDGKHTRMIEFNEYLLVAR